MSAREIYEQSIRQLPAIDRLRLASLILDDLASTSTALDLRNEWSDEDIAEVTAFSIRRAAASVPVEDDNG